MEVWFSIHFFRFISSPEMVVVWLIFFLLFDKIQVFLPRWLWQHVKWPMLSSFYIIWGGGGDFCPFFTWRNVVECVEQNNNWPKFWIALVLHSCPKDKLLALLDDDDDGAKANSAAAILRWFSCYSWKLTNFLDQMTSWWKLSSQSDLLAQRDIYSRKLRGQPTNQQQKNGWQIHAKLVVAPLHFATSFSSWPILKMNANSSSVWASIFTVQWQTTLIE